MTRRRGVPLPSTSTSAPTKFTDQPTGSGRSPPQNVVDIVSVALRAGFDVKQVGAVERSRTAGTAAQRSRC